jgi:aldehyde dehydrogenase (NAD+)
VPVTLELGGKSPQIVFADADLDAALPFLVNAGIQNAGQTCSAASRILVERSVFDAVRERMAERYRALRVGPASPVLDVGPVISARQRDGIEACLALARDDGLEFVAQAELPPGTPAGGYYVRPTLLAGAAPSHRLAQQEIFGPVQLLLPFDGEAEAVAVANGTHFGLVAGVWTRDGSRALRLARKLKCGQVFINNYGAGGGVELPFDGEAEALAIANGTSFGLVAGVWTRDGSRALRLARQLKCGQVFINNYGAGGGIELPFGGVKHSGHGREKGFEALYGFSTLKTVAIHHG